MIITFVGYIKLLKLQNFKRFQSFKAEFDKNLNILVGDNESGKSSVIEAIHIALSGSRSKVDSIGIEALFNTDIIEEFLSGRKDYNNLPTMWIELYFDEQANFELNGRNNSEEIVYDGLRMECIPNDDFSNEIKEILRQSEPLFPFEFYSIRFLTFSGDPYSGYKKYLKHLLVDNSIISSEYAIKEYVKDMYNSIATTVERNKNQNNYRKHKDLFRREVLNEINTRVQEYKFSIRSNPKSNLESDLTLIAEAINIENKGKGLQCFIKTAFALKNEGNLDILLLEEPENHLSHINMNKLIWKIRSTASKQIFITTHNDLISTRLDLRNCLLLNSNSDFPISLKTIPESTAKFFMKAPDNNLLELVLSKKVILVEGDAEFILMEAFYKIITGANLAESDVHVISVDGTSFKRYLQISRALSIKTAIIRDNDGDYQENCVENYMEFSTDTFIKVFSESDNTLSTFEISMYKNNKALCESLFSQGRRQLTVEQFMLSNKTEAAYELLLNYSYGLVVPNYIKQATEWISE